MKRLCLTLCVKCAFFVGVLSNIRRNDFSDWKHNDTSTSTPSTMPLVPLPDPLNKHPTNSCEPENFSHDYMIDKDTLRSEQNVWNRAKANESAVLVKICLRPNGLPVTRKCLFDPKLGAVWEPIDNWPRVKCISKPQQQIITKDLADLETNLSLSRSSFSYVEDRKKVVKEIRTILEKPKFTFLPADVFYATTILSKVFESHCDEQLSKDVITICDTFMSMDENILYLSAELNSTNTFLQEFENYMDSITQNFVPSAHCNSWKSSEDTFTYNDYSDKGIRRTNMIETIDYSHIGVYAHLATNISVFFVNPKCANITGIAVYDRKNVSSGLGSQTAYESRGKFYYRFLYKNESITELMAEPGIQVATFLPEHLWEYAKNKLRRSEQYIVLKVYAHDSLFVDSSPEQTCRPSSKIISISIPGFTGSFPEPLPFLIRNNLYNPNSPKSLAEGTGCGYWNYSTWLRDGVNTSLRESEGPVILCGTTHLTQFSFLLGGSYRQNDISDDILITPMHLKALNIISLVGSSLSLLGLLGIWITALLFKSWRSISSTKVLLNMCLALTFQMVLYLFVNTSEMARKLITERSYYECVALGATMQYSLLVLFTWMLLIAFLQFQRYVTVLGVQRPRHFILKAALIAWIVPLLPTLIVVFVDPKCYIPNDIDIYGGTCYPSGYGLTFGVVLPVSMICIANLTIFVYVFYSISHTLNQSMHRQEKQMLVKQIRLSILLFFLLGLCWIFGLLASMNSSLVFSYLFCLTATLQGFVLFLYFVVFNETARKAWINLLCPGRLEKPKSKLQEMQSITASSAIESVSERR